MNGISDTFKRLKDEYLLLANSEENSRRRRMWQGLARSGRDQYRPTPKSDRSWKDGEIPITVDLQNPVWSLLFGFDMEKYYFDAQEYFENYLRIMIYRFKNFQDDTFLTMDIPMWGTCVMEGSLFNIPFHVFKDKDPWLDPEPILKDEEDLKRMPEIDFRTSGAMPVLINMYEELCGLGGDEFDVLFPEWIRGPFGVGVYIRGYEDLLVDMLANEDFYHAYMRLIVDARKKWFSGLEKYLGRSAGKANMFNDEVSGQLISSAMYRDKVLPFEQDLCDFHGGLLYWHSCADVSSLTDEIAKLEDIELFNVGAWTSAYRAGISFRDKTPLEICMHPQIDIHEGTEQIMKERVRSILDECYRADVAGMGLKVSALNVQNSLEELLNRVNLWIKAAREVSETA